MTTKKQAHLQTAEADMQSKICKKSLFPQTHRLTENM
jgi:hypothetical protein